MSNNRTSSSDKKKNSKTGGQTGQSGPAKKRKSAGFIETSGFKPNWLETGPLTPEILRDSLAAQEQVELPADEGEQEDAAQSNTPPLGEGESVVEVTAAAAPAEEPLVEAAEAIQEPHTPNGVEQDPVQSVDQWLWELLREDKVAHESGANEINAIRMEPETTESPEGTLWANVAESIPERIAHDPAQTFDVTAEPEPVEPISAAAVAAAPEFEPSRPALSSTTKRGDRWTPALLITSLILLGLAAITLFINPFGRLAMNSATVAAPAESSAVAPQSGSGNWCVSGSFLGESGNLRLADGGSQGDILAGDRVFSLDHTIAQPGTHQFQIIDCDNPSLAYPETTAWLETTQANQQVTFVFDTTGRATPLFSATPYVVSAIDGTADFRVIGSHQNWSESDPSSQMSMISDGLFQQVRRIALPGSYEARFLAGDASQSVDSFGRTDNPVSLPFSTSRNGEPVVFLLDTDRGQASVLYDISPLLASLAFGNGYRLLSYLLIGAAGLLLLLMAARLLTLKNSRLRMEHGCPQCGQPELMRISRRTTQRLQNSLGIPAYRYRCRNCTWEGTRLSDRGEAFSPGALFAQTEEY